MIKKEIKEELSNSIMKEFVNSDLKANDVIPVSWLKENGFSKNDSDKQDNFFDTVVSELVLEGLLLIDIRDGEECLALTEKGYNIIY